MDENQPYADLSTAAAAMADMVKKELRDFRRPIRYIISGADGAVLGIEDKEVKTLLNPAHHGRAVQVMKLPLHILFIDADGRELTARLTNVASHS